MMQALKSNEVDLLKKVMEQAAQCGVSFIRPERYQFVESELNRFELFREAPRNSGEPRVARIDYEIWAKALALAKDFGIELLEDPDLNTHDLSPRAWDDEDEAYPFRIDGWESLATSELTPRSMSRHFLILGETGSGKTSSAVQPLIASALNYVGRSGKRASMLVIDPKFELKAQLAKADGNRAFIPLDINKSHLAVPLFDDSQRWSITGSAAVEYLIINCCPNFMVSTEPFWPESARQLLSSLVEIDLHLRRQHNTNIWLTLSKEVSTDTELLENWTQSGVCEDNANYFLPFYNFIGLCLTSKKFINCVLNLCSQFTVPATSSVYLRIIKNGPEGQVGSQLSTTQNLLAELSSPQINRIIDMFPGPNRNTTRRPLSFVKELDKGSLIVFSPSDTSTATTVAGRLIKTKFFEACFRRKQKDRPVFYVCDEFQRFITGDAESGEQSFLDRCRAYRVSCILATQSVASLSYALLASRNTGSLQTANSAMSILMNNTGNKLFFRNTDDETQGRLRSLFPRSPVQSDTHILDRRPVSSLRVGECYYILANGELGIAQVREKEVAGGNILGSPTFALNIAKGLDVNGVLELCDNIDRLIEYQKARIVTLKINSPGGEIPALDYFLTNLKQWRAKGLVVATAGLIEVSSAAAIILALGNIGYRSAYASTRILFHNSRIILDMKAGMSVVTKDSAIAILQSLDRADLAIEERLVNHLFSGDEHETVDFNDDDLKQLQIVGVEPGVQAWSPDLFRQIYRFLSWRDQPITASQALKLRLIDTIIDV